MKKMKFLTNPRGRKAAKRRATSSRTKRRPPKGFPTWKAYMASIRPNKPKKKPRSSPTSRGSVMAKKRRTKRHTAPRSTVAPRRRARHTRRNPPANVRGIIGMAQTAAVGAAEVLAGKIAVRKARGLAGQKAGTLFGSIIEAAVGIGGGLLVGRMVSREFGERFAIGGFLAPMETLVQQMGIPHISDSLGDDGYELTGDLGYVVSDDDADELAGVDDVNVLGDDDDLAGYVGQGDGLGDYVGQGEGESQYEDQ